MVAVADGVVKPEGSMGFSVMVREIPPAGVEEHGTRAKGFPETWEASMSP
jgi:hypothetical protein